MEEATEKPARFTVKLWDWVREHYLESVALFLLAFIPLYPKLPLFEPITGYIVRVRLEDLFIAGAFILWLNQLVKGQVRLTKNPLTKPVLAYLGIGLLSVLSALFITRTVPLAPVHVTKLLLHYFRRIEYFFLVFLFFSVVKEVAVAKRAAVVFGLSVAGVTVYGFGQKYLLWPAFSTMNREFAKGWRLYLTEHARVISTFGGHYDLAAWLVLVLMTLIALSLLLTSRRVKMTSLGLFVGAYLLLLLTASRASFLAYLVALTFLILLLLAKKGIFWALTRWAGLLIFSFSLLFTFGDMAERFGHIVGQGRLSDYLELLMMRYRPPQESLVVTTDQVASLTDQPPTVGPPSPPTGERPPDVYGDIPAKIKEEIVLDEQGRPTIVRRAVPREYSQTAVTYGLSSAIRFDVLWPRALAGFKRNPLLGSGYSTLTKAKIEEFTEAESTDNDYLRALGETGLLGVLALAWVFSTIGRQVKLGLTWLKDPFLLALTASLGAATVGLLVNALYIDVFEASKVAEPFWAWTGLVLGVIQLSLPEKARQRQPAKKIPLTTVALGLIILGGGLVRLYRINAPLADWHSWRQADTAAVARNFAKDGLDLLHPRFDDLSSIPSGLPNPKGYRMVEFPFQGALIAVAATIAPTWSLLIWGRLISIGFSLFSIVLVYLLAKRHSGERTGILSAFFFALLPFNIYYSRVILPEPLLLTFILAGLYFFDLLIAGWKGELVPSHSQTKVNWLIGGAALLSMMMALLLKPFAVFFWPALLYLLWQSRRPSSAWLKTIGLLFLATGPFLAWRWWIGRYPEGIPAWEWLLNSDGIRLRPAWFRWLFAERFGKLILGYWGTLLFGLGLLVRPTKKEGWYYHFLGLGALAYLVIIATGNVTHDYYQVILMPLVAFFLGRGLNWLITPPKGLSKPLVWLVTPLVVLFSLAFSWYQIRDYFNINNPAIVEAGKAVDTLVGPDVKVIAPYGGDTAFLYQTQRKGWPIGGKIREKISQGAEFYVSVDLNSAEVKELADAYSVVEKTDQYIIIQLLPKGGED